MCFASRTVLDHARKGTSILSAIETKLFEVRPMRLALVSRWE